MKRKQDEERAGSEEVAPQQRSLFGSESESSAADDVAAGSGTDEEHPSPSEGAAAAHGANAGDAPEEVERPLAHAAEEQRTVGSAGEPDALGSSSTGKEAADHSLGGERDDASEAVARPADPRPDRSPAVNGRPTRSTAGAHGGPRRVFLGWERPLLELATEWLVEYAAGSGFGYGFGLPDTAVVVPGRRAGRLLLDRLTAAARAQGRVAILPPEILTVGTLPERILAVGPPTPEPTLRIARAARLREVCIRPGAGERFVADALEVALGGRPEDDDWGGWTDLAQRLEEVAVRLEAVGLPVDRAARRVEGMSGGTFAAPGGESERWQAWRELDQWLTREMDSIGLPPRSQQRFEALAEGRLRDLSDLPDRLVLVGLAELSPMVRDLLDTAYGDSGTRADGGGVDCLIHSPRAEQDRFDAFGCPDPDEWSLADGPLVEALGRPGVSTEFVERPADQVGSALTWVMETLQEVPTSPEPADPPHRGPTVGVGDELSAERVVQGLAARGVAGHAPRNRRLDQTEPGRALLTASRYANRGGLDALMRCLAVRPIHRWVEESQCSLPEREVHSSSRAAPFHAALGAGDLVAFVDAVGREGIGGRVPLRLDPEVHLVLQRIEAAVRVLLAPEEAFETFEGDVTRIIEAVIDPDVDVDVTPPSAALPDQAELLLAALRRLESTEMAARADEDDGEAVRDLEDLEQVVAMLQEATLVRGSPSLRVDEVARTLLESPARPAEADPDAQVEIVGWLELGFDPSTRLVVLDLNEGKVPTRPAADPILPDSTLEALGGASEASRLARDAFLLTSLLHSRQAVRLLACRRDESGEPLLPSRLLLAGAAEDLARRVMDAFGAEEAGGSEPAEAATRLWLSPGRPRSGRGVKAESFEPTRPPTHPAALTAYAQRLRRLRVTDFRRYLSCPYRFFLDRVLGSEPAQPWPAELDARSFGIFVHEVLRRFGRGEGADLDDPEAVLERLRSLSAGLARSNFGIDPPLSVAIQLEHLDRRFESFARWQAAHRAAGWRVQTDLTERDVSCELDVDGEPVEIVGRIDRVDLHPEHGYLLLDYKTGDRAVKAASARAARSGVWNDLQLPLYREIARRRRDLFRPETPVGTGLVRLSKQIGARALSLGTWCDEDYADALEAARDVVRAMRHGVFWPPASPPRFADGFEWAAGDRLVGWKPDAGSAPDESAGAGDG